MEWQKFSQHDIKLYTLFKFLITNFFHLHYTKGETLLLDDNFLGNNVVSNIKKARFCKKNCVWKTWLNMVRMRLWSVGQLVSIVLEECLLCLLHSCSNVIGGCRFWASVKLLLLLVFAGCAGSGQPLPEAVAADCLSNWWFAWWSGRHFFLYYLTTLFASWCKFLIFFTLHILYRYRFLIFFTLHILYSDYKDLSWKCIWNWP